jgi:hypothetical protein
MLAIPRAELETVVGGNWVTDHWKKADCVTKANMVSEVGEATGATAGFFAGYGLTHKFSEDHSSKKAAFIGAVTGFALSKITEGISRQATFAIYNESCLDARRNRS